MFLMPGTIVAGFLLKDVEMITRGIDDRIVEPLRKDLIPGYDSVKKEGTRGWSPCCHNQRSWPLHDFIFEK